VTVSEIKPIAVLTDKITHAIDFLLENKKIREANGAKRLLIGHNGEKYVIISEPEHLLAWELSEILVVPGAAKNPRYSEMYDLARTRIR